MGGRLSARRRFAGVAILAATALLASACPSLQEIPLGECGNGVIEADLGEECDAAPEAADKTSRGEHCARANEADACHFVWNEATCCPEGAGAGVDGRCRYPSGIFDPNPIERIDQAPLGVAVTEVDGDGYPDLAIRYASRELELRLLGPDADRTPIRDAQPIDPAARPSFGSLAPPVEPARDVCQRVTAFAPGAVFIPTDVGVRILLGRPGEALLPKSLPSLDTPLKSLPIALPASACRVDLDGFEELVPSSYRCPGAISDVGPSMRLSALDAAEDEGLQSTTIAELEGTSIAHVVGDVQVVRMPASGCDGVLIHLGDDVTNAAHRNKALVVATCRAAGGDVVASIAVARGSRVFSVDIDQDGNDDLVVGSEEQLDVALGDGLGSFGGEDRTYELPFGFADDLGVPVALGFLGSDPGIDVVNEFAVMVSKESCTPPDGCDFEIAGAILDGKLSDAVLADVNGDGQRDVVAGMIDPQPALAVGLSSIDGLYTFDIEPLAAQPDQLVAADFDGDGIGDAAAFVPSSARCAEPDQIRVLYGQHGAPGATEVVAELDGINGIAGGPLVPIRVLWDGIGDLGVTSTCEVEGEPQHRATILYGSVQRGFASPYALVGAGESQEYVVFATGRLAGGDAHPDLAGVGFRDYFESEFGELTIWIAPSTGNADLPTSEMVEPFYTGLAHELQGLSLFAPVVADLDCPADADPASCTTDEIAIFEAAHTTDEFDNVDEVRLSTFDPESGSLVTTPSCPGTAGAAEYAGYGENVGGEEDLEDLPTMTFASAIDVDGDGLRDIVAWWVGYGATGAAQAGRAFVFWNGPAGPASACPQEIRVPAGQFLTSVASIRAGDAPTLALGTQSAAYLASFGADRRLDVCGDGAEPGVCAQLQIEGALLGLGVVDYDLDGLDDLVVSATDSIRVLRQLSRDDAMFAEDEARLAPATRRGF